ncbi:MAG: hypothetical protein F6K19_01265 [Cyanothece sp. SIO1E1]|nr:hypothetical protein [Cyanothece sp. SIO1E1]
MALQRKLRKPEIPKKLWFERLMAIFVLVNLGFVAFDISYIPWRDFYLKYAPGLTQRYGQRFKGIEPHRVTEAYLRAVTELEKQVAQDGLSASTQSEQLLAQLQTLSVEIIDENPFAMANKSGTLERIKNRMRDHLGNESAKQSFMRFWSQAHLRPANWLEEINFFNEEISPLIETNYFRKIGIDGRPLDLFWQIDLWFVGLFSLEFLARVVYLRRRYRGITWFDAVLWRWYDLFLLIPFWRWLRVVPVTIRLNRSRLVDLEPIHTRITRGLVASFAVELTEIVVIRIIDQMQNLIRQGTVARWLLQSDPSRRYIDINGVDELEVISQQLLSILVDQVLPTIKPEVEDLLHYSVTGALQKSSVYANLQSIPGVRDWSDRLTRQLVAEVSQNTYGVLAASLEDEAGAALAQRLAQKFSETLKAQLQQEQTLNEMESLITALLEEVKINYVQRIAQEDIEALREQTHKLYEITQAQRN